MNIPAHFQIAVDRSIPVHEFEQSVRERFDAMAFSIEIIDKKIDFMFELLKNLAETVEVLAK